jgi:UDP-3-O-[3-hydroxymyristoyl] glucosamine N-acyltransferase
MADIVIFGTGAISEVAKAYIDRHSTDRIVAFTVDREYCSTGTFLALPVVPWEELEQQFPPNAVKLLGPLTYSHMNELRRDRHVDGKARGYSFTSFVHPGSHVYAAEIGENCLILENNVIQPFVKIGNGVIIWSASHIGHHATIGDYCFISSQVAVGGFAKLGDRCFIGGQVGIESQVELGAACFLDSGVLIKKNLAAESVVRSFASPVSRARSSRLKRLRFR